MNVLFHTTAAIGVAVMLTDTHKVKPDTIFKDSISTGFFAFVTGIISHGALDYIPHCYPVNSKADAILGLATIITLTLLTVKKYRPIIGLAFTGSIFPDMIDLSPAILNKYLGLSFPITDNIFPWHWHDYSGSIYTQECDVSAINHFIVLMIVAIVCWFRQADLKTMFDRRK